MRWRHCLGRWGDRRRKEERDWEDERQALRRAVPELSNTDQGSQFTCDDYVCLLERHGVRISMDGRGRAFDNIMIERLWWSVKYEHVYVHEPPTVPVLVDGIGRYFTYYNTQRQHQALGYRTPAQVYFGSAAASQPCMA